MIKDMVERDGLTQLQEEVAQAGGQGVSPELRRRMTELQGALARVRERGGAFARVEFSDEVKELLYPTQPGAAGLHPQASRRRVAAGV